MMEPLKGYIYEVIIAYLCAAFIKAKMHTYSRFPVNNDVNFGLKLPYDLKTEYTVALESHGLLLCSTWV